VLDPELKMSEALRASLQEAIAAWDWYRLASLDEPEVEPRRLLILTLALSLEAEARIRLADRLALAGRDRERLLSAPARIAAAAAALEGAELEPHAVYRALGALYGEELLALLAAGNEARRAWVRRWWLDLRPIRLAVRGSDLVARGVPPGPEVGQALAATLDARLDGRLARDGELDYALATVRRLRPAEALGERSR